MEVTGGTDIDWLIEHRGGFIVMENKQFQSEHISLPLGQMIAFEKLYEKLNSDDKCHFLIFGYDDIDFKNPDSILWYFDMNQWLDNKIPYEKDSKYKRYKIERKNMHEISINEYRRLMEKYWKEFENS